MAPRIRYCLQSNRTCVIWNSLDEGTFRAEPLRRLTPIDGKQYLLDVLLQGFPPYDFTYHIRLFLPCSTEIVVGWVHQSCVTLTSEEGLFDGRFNSYKEQA